jgi:hypothetical protein
MSDNEQSGPFGGLSPSEAGRKSWENRRQRAAEAEAAESELDDEDELDLALRRIAQGSGPGAVAAVRLLDERRSRQTEANRDKRLLQPSEQRTCIAAYLRDEPVPPDLALSAWSVLNDNKTSEGASHD